MGSETKDALSSFAEWIEKTVFVRTSRKAGLVAKAAGIANDVDLSQLPGHLVAIVFSWLTKSPESPFYDQFSFVLYSLEGKYTGKVTQFAELSDGQSVIRLSLCGFYQGSSGPYFKDFVLLVEGNRIRLLHGSETYSETTKEFASPFVVTGLRVQKVFVQKYDYRRLRVIALQVLAL